MLVRILAAATLAATVAAGVTNVAAAQGTASEGGTASAPKPAADTNDPGKTATDAVTDPAAVPPSEGRAGSGQPPDTGRTTPPASPPR